MDRKLILQLLLNKTEEIQSLLNHFKSQPGDLESGLDMLSDRIEGLGKDFDLLKKNSVVAEVSKTTPELKENLVREIKEEPSPEVEKELAPEQPLKIEEPKEVVEITETIEPTVMKEVETPISNGETKEEESAILNDQLQASASGVLGEQLSTHRLKDVQSAIGINDRFLFIRELFGNSAEDYNSAIEFVNQSANYTVVDNWIKNEKDWDPENPTVNQFIEVVKRKF
jgi:hypothetical protein